MEKKDIIKIQLLAGATALIQLAAGFAIVKSNNKKIDLSTAQKIEYYASEENVANQLEVAPSIETSISKAKINPPTKPDVRIRDPYDHRGPQLRTNLNEHGEIITSNTNTNSEENSSMIEDIGELADMFSSNENMFMKNSVNLPTNTNIGGPYRPGDKNNPLYEAIHQHTQDIANAHSDENEIVKNSVNLPTQTRIGDPYEPGHGNNPLLDAIRARTLELAGIKENPIYEQIRENAPHMDEIRRNELYEMDPSLNPLNRPPYQAAAENIEEYNKSK